MSNKYELGTGAQPDRISPLLGTLDELGVSGRASSPQRFKRRPR